MEYKVKRKLKMVLKISILDSPINEKMRESRLTWFNHVQMRTINVQVRKNELVKVEKTKKGRGKPKKNINRNNKKNDLSFK